MENMEKKNERTFEDLINSTEAVGVSLSEEEIMMELASSSYILNGVHNVRNALARYDGLDYITDNERSLLPIGYVW